MDLAHQLQSCYQLYQSGNLQAAEQSIGQIVQQFPNATDAFHLGAIIAARMGQAAIAVQRIDLALTRRPTHHEYLNTKGNILTTLQNIPEAVSAFEAALAARPDYLQAAQNLGRCLIDNDDALSAIAVYEKALSHHPDNEQLKVAHVIALKSAVRSSEALAALKTIKDADNYSYLKGQILLQLGRHEEAISANKKALTQPATAAPALKNMMQSYWMQGKWDAGQRELNSVLESNKASEGHFLSAANIYLRAENLDLVETVLDRAQSKFGLTPDIGAARARLNLNRGNSEAAWEQILAALTARQGDLHLMETYAECAMVTGRHNEAMTAAHAALNQVPNNQFWIAMKYTAGRARGQDYKFYADTEKFVKTYSIEPPDKYASIEDFNGQLKQALNDLHNFDQHPLDQSLRLGTQTPTDLRFSSEDVIQDFFDALDKPIKAYMNGLGTRENHPLENRNTGKYRFAGAWSVLLKAGGHHVNHVHPKGWISSAYYVDVPDEVEKGQDKAGWIQFGQPPFEANDQHGNALGPERFVKPEAGMIALFPSYLWHGTLPITGVRPGLPYLLMRFRRNGKTIL